MQRYKIQSTDFTYENGVIRLSYSHARLSKFTFTDGYYSNLASVGVFI